MPEPVRKRESLLLLLYGDLQLGKVPKGEGGRRQRRLGEQPR
jgi:hypothetical protein